MVSHKRRRYRRLSPDQLERSRTESLKDAADRIMPFFSSVIAPSMRAGNKCIIVSHANTIRTLIKHIDGISDQDIKGMTIPTGIPLLYRLDKNLKPVDPQIELEFRYLVEPKGYVVMLLRRMALSQKPGLILSTAIPGAHPAPTAFTASIWATSSVFKRFSASAT